MTMKHFIISSLFLIILGASQGLELILGPFIDDDSFAQCKADLALADADQNLELYVDEYIDFIKIHSNGSIVYDKLRDFPLEFILLFVRTACACIKEPNPPAQCCVRDNAHVNVHVDGTAAQEFYLMEFCSDGLDAICGVLEPTSAPSYAPTVSAGPTVSPVPSMLSEMPSTAAPVLTERPTASPTTAMPTVRPSAHPSAHPSIAQSDRPSGAPSSSPTALSSSQPSMVGSHMPSITSSPSIEVTTLSPTGMPTISLAPTEYPSAFPSSSPTRVGQILLSFQYGLQNDRGLDAAAILSGVNNTVKEGLIEATATIVTNILNASFPIIPGDDDSGSSASITSPALLETREDPGGATLVDVDGDDTTTRAKNETSSQEPGRSRNRDRSRSRSRIRSSQDGEGGSDISTRDGGLRSSSSSRSRDVRDRTFVPPRRKVDEPLLESTTTSSTAVEEETSSSSTVGPSIDDVDDASSTDSDHDARPYGTYERIHDKRPRQMNHRRRLLSLREEDDSSLSSSRPNIRRRLVYYTPEIPVIIRNVIDNPRCPEGRNCVIVFSSLYLILGPGDDAELVKKTVLDGLSQSFRDESFIAAIPEGTLRL